MALFRLNQPGPAGQAAADADQVLGDLGFTPGVDDFAYAGPENYLTCSVARREARALLGTVSPADK